MTTVTCAFCSASITGGHVTLPLGADNDAKVDQIAACWSCRHGFDPLWRAYQTWHWDMARRASGELPPLPSSVWTPTPESTP